VLDLGCMRGRLKPTVAYAWLALGLAACGSSGASAPDAADSDAAPPGPSTCADYCTTIQAACVGPHQQYSDLPDCMSSCTAFPVGASGDQTGDTLGCRVTFAHQVAKNPSAMATVCPQAGPGGDGVCGDNCGGYCDIAMMFCTDVNAAKIYDSRAACLADCATRMTTVKLNAGSPNRTDLGDEVACLLYHAQMAATAPVGHCLGDLGGATCQAQ
jgi:hypothetical protein